MQIERDIEIQHIDIEIQKQEAAAQNGICYPLYIAVPWKQNSVGNAKMIGMPAFHIGWGRDTHTHSNVHMNGAP